MSPYDDVGFAFNNFDFNDQRKQQRTKDVSLDFNTKHWHLYWKCFSMLNKEAVHRGTMHAYRCWVKKISLFMTSKIRVIHKINWTINGKMTIFLNIDDTDSMWTTPSFNNDWESSKKYFCTVVGSIKLFISHHISMQTTIVPLYFYWKCARKEPGSKLVRMRIIKTSCIVLPCNPFSRKLSVMLIKYPMILKWR